MAQLEKLPSLNCDVCSLENSQVSSVHIACRQESYRVLFKRFVRYCGVFVAVAVNGFYAWLVIRPLICNARALNGRC